jgi:diguanylate cyclase (GGDEF)-like protein/PAS domain S-box-containing protein
MALQRTCTLTRLVPPPRRSTLGAVRLSARHRVRRWLTGAGQDPLRVTQRYFTAFAVVNILTIVPQVLRLHPPGPRTLIVAPVVAILIAIRLAEYRRGRPLPVWSDLLEVVALGVVVATAQRSEVVQGTLFAILHVRAVLATLPRLILLVLGFGLVVVVPTAAGLNLDHHPPGEVLALAIVPSVLYLLRTLMLRDQREQRQRKALLDLVVGRLPSAVVVVDGAGVVTLSNPAADMLIGWPAGACPRTLEDLDLRDLDLRPVDVAALARSGARDVDLVLTAADGTQRRVALDAHPLADHLAEAQGIVIGLQDITDQRLYEEQLRHLASHDSLTGLPNRLLFQQRLAAAAHGATRYAVMLIDLDDFKAVNDTHGHPTGDELLQAVAARLTVHAGDGATVARLGGDEFAVLLPDPDHTRGSACAEAISRSFQEPFVLDHVSLRCGGTVGLAHAEPGTSPRTVLGAADLAMYARKPWRASGKITYVDLGVGSGNLSD